MSATIDELTVADEPGTWEALGFAVEGDACVVGEVRIHLAGPHAGERLVGWSLRDAGGVELDGLPRSGPRGDRRLAR